MDDTLLPPNATPMQTALAKTCGAIGDIPVPTKTVWDPDTCPAALLPWLAWSLSIDVWNPDWPESVKRQVIAASFDVHRKKGTDGAIIRSLESMELDAVKLINWRDCGGAPHTFDVEVELFTRGLTDKEDADIRAAIFRAKNARSNLGALKIFLTSTGTSPRLAASCVTGETVTVEPYSPSELSVTGLTPVYASAMYTVETITVDPQ